MKENVQITNENIDNSTSSIVNQSLNKFYQGIKDENKFQRNVLLKIIIYLQDKYMR